ncbi:MAG TPA: Fic family protein [Solirubrobacteraceae bacterium]|jgi:hypothetical protein|nr:Fic family protein [Solirubrobacteraceae bacterium]
MRAGFPFDDRRIELFSLLHRALLAQAPVERSARPSDDPAVFAFYEAYFSNYIEGTRFTVQEAADIVFHGIVPTQRPDDARDIQGTFQLIHPPATDASSPHTSDELIELLRLRHRIMLTGRPEVNPGEFKTENNQAGGTTFVDRKLVLGTLREGFRFYLGLPDGLTRAVFIMFLITEIHPFADGNGRIARVFMNAELTAAGQQRIVVPTGYRQNYLSALSGLSHNDRAAGLVRALDFAHRYSAMVDWSSRPHAQRMLEATGAFEENGDSARIRLPEPWD